MIFFINKLLTCFKQCNPVTKELLFDSVTRMENDNDTDSDNYHGFVSFNKRCPVLEIALFMISFIKNYYKTIVFSHNNNMRV